MFILLISSLSVAFLYLLWPIILARAIRRNPDEGGEKCGERLIFVGIALVVIFYLTLVLPDCQRSWVDAEPAISAVLITVAIFFGYGRFLPSSFYSAYLQVTNWSTGEWDQRRLSELTIEKGKLWPIFLVVHNTGIASWNNYRITVEFKDDFEVFAELDGFPSSKTWAWKTKGLRISKKPCWVQLQATNVLAIGEPQTLRFLVKSDKLGKFKVKIRVVSDGRPGERRQSLWLNVN